MSKYGVFSGPYLDTFSRSGDLEQEDAEQELETVLSRVKTVYKNARTYCENRTLYV